MNIHRLIAHVECHVTHPQMIAGEVFLDEVTFVAEADDEVIDPEMGVHLHDVPKDRTAANFHQRLRLDHRFLGKPRPQAAG